MKMLRKLCWGQYPLVSAFWGFYVFGFFASWIVAGAIAAPFLLWHMRPIGFGIWYALTISYLIVATLGTWRSADAYPLTRWWPVLAKIWICIWSARIIWGLSNGGAAMILNRVTASN